MTTINRTMYPVKTSMRLITGMQDQFSKLQTQLATGKSAANLAEMGSSRSVDLSIRNRVSRIDGYQSSTTMLNLRLNTMGQLGSRLDDLESSSRSLMVPANYGSNNANFGTAPTLARSSLDQLVDILNTDINGHYLFSGTAGDQRPVPDTATLLDGANGKAGFRQVAAERQAADVGDGLGRLTLTSATNAVTLKEDGTHPFGFKLSTATASNLSSITPSLTAGPPAQVDLTVATQPTDGDTVTLGLTLPDGTSASISLKAVTGAPKAGEFQIGADVDATAANLKTALQSALTSAASTTLVGASNNEAAENFFNGQGAAVQRVPGPNFATATSLVTADPTTTVLWYQGSDSADARGSVKAKVDDSATISYGAQANESGTAALMRGLAVMAIQSFSTADSTSSARYDAVAGRNQDRLSELHNSDTGSIENLTVEIGTAAATVKDISDRQTAYKAQLTGMLNDMEGIDDNTVTMQILALQTQLQASYQTTALVAQLSLVNFIK